MSLEKYIETNKLSKSKCLKYYFLGKEDKLFLTDDHDDIRKLGKSNKKEFRMLLYRANYFLALFFLIGSIVMISSGGLIMLLPFFFVFIKPLGHFFALGNKRKKKNIAIYKNYYGN
ncbi:MULTISPECIES: hypothetical protein [unclassified Lacinutrix]